MIQTKNGIIYGLSYFTVLPFKVTTFEADSSFYKGVLYSLPIVGAILGLLTVLIYAFLPFHPLYNGFVASIFYILLYGMLHLEAVADTIDGYFASLSNKDIYEIVHEPQIGALGAIGTFCFILLKISSITYLLYLEQYFLLILAFVLSRVSVIFALEFEFHKKSSFVLSLKENYSSNKILDIVLLPLRVVTRFILSKLKKHLGFLNGDSLGFLIVVNEIILLNIGLILC